MRVIAGLAKGHRLMMPRAEGVRPTRESVREALFNILGDSVRGRVVLDLFAGSGALGIEALSRGATWAVFVDEQIGCVKAIRENLDRCGFGTRASVIQARIPEDLPKVKKAGESGFDLVFMDPPYGSGREIDALEGLLRFALLRENARIVCEHARRRTSTPAIKDFRLEKARRYGDSVITFLNFEPGAKNGDGQREEE